MLDHSTDDATNAITDTVLNGIYVWYLKDIFGNQSYKWQYPQRKKNEI